MNDIEPPPQITVWNWHWTKWLYNFWAWAQEHMSKDYGMQVALGQETGVSNVTKFGRCSDNVDQNVQTDLWAGANAAYGDVVYVLPTAARIHSIVSTSTADDDGSTGAYSVTVFGLTDWDTPEVSETVTLDGTNAQNTTNSYVIINRMFCNFGANTTAASNVGVITATAATDGTVSAYILAGEGQTTQAIFGWPSTQSLYVTSAYVTIDRAVANTANAKILFNANPDVQRFGFLEKDVWAANSTGTTHSMKDYKKHPRKFSGPGILKVTANGGANNMDVAGGFNGYLVTNQT